MKKNILKNQKGITLVVLITTIVVIALLAGVAISNIDIGTDIRNYNYMKADIELLEAKVMTYYNKNGSLPIIPGAISGASSMLNGQASTRDNNVYYQIDISKLYNVTLNYGGGTLSNKDIYIINEQSHEVYYLKGATYEGTLYHTEK